MAAHLSHLKPVFKKIQQDLFTKSSGFVRNASRGVGQGNRGRQYKYGLKKQEFEDVKPGNILYHNTRLVFCPGLNVALGGYNKLYSKVAGKLYFSFEKTDFKPGSTIVENSFPNYIPSYKAYLNVVPEPLHKRFKLIEKF